jgi:hypothetical protein
MTNQRSWSVHLQDGVVAEVPVPNGHVFDIRGIQAVDLTANKIVVEVLSIAIRVDKRNNDEDAPIDVTRAVAAVLFPRVQPIAELSLTFSELNLVSLRATGGPVTVTGTWIANGGICDL